MFTMISASFTLMSLIRNAIFVFCGHKIAKNLFQTMLFYFVHSKIDDFLDRVSITIILNRFQKDLEKIDRSIMMNLSSLLMIVCFTLAEYFFIVYSTHVVLIAVIVP